ncbi:MAG: iron-siderophore ABC transporter substrate-binding protein [Caldilineaceae bacterium]
MMKRTLILTLTIVMLLTAACQPAVPSATDAAADAPAADAVRTVTDALGNEVTISANPQRVVTLTEIDLDSALALGLTPVGSVNGRGQLDLPAYLSEMTDGITSVGSLAEPSLEAIVALDPDLILAGNMIPAIEALLPELSEIAPVVATYQGSDDWKTTFQHVAEILNRQREADAFLAEYDAIANQIASSLGDETVEVSITRWMPQGPVVMIPASFSSLVLADAGLARPEAHAGLAGDHPAHSDPISLESLDLIDGDWIFLGTLNEEGATSLAEAQENVLFQQLSAVQNEHVVPVDGTVWTSVGGPLAAMQVLQDVAAAFGIDLMRTEAANADQTSCEAGFRRFDHELLATDPVCIPEDPQRIIALDVASVELTLMTGKTLLATSDWILSEMPLMSPQFADTLAATEDVGYPANLEKILLLKPDLILAVDGTNVGDTIDVAAALQIAPVVIADPVIYEDWKLGTQFWSAVLNVTDFYTAMEENYFTRIGELQAALGDPAALEVSVIGASTYGIYLWMPDTPPGHILRDVGLSRPEAQALIGEESLARYQASQYVLISEERLDLVDGDAIFYFTYFSSNPETAAKETAFLDALAQKPLWQALSAVKADSAFQVPGYWWRSQTYLLASKVIDDLFTHLTDTEATTLILAGQ